MWLRKWATLLFKDELPEPEDRLIPDEFYAPRQQYTDADITPTLIIHNHLAHLDDKLNILGRGMERIWTKQGYHDAVLSIFKKLILGATGSAIAYTTNHLWMPVLQTVAEGRLF